MSLIGEFFILSRDDLDELQKVARPVEKKTRAKFLGFIPITKSTIEDQFWEWVDTNSTERILFDYSGRAIADLELFLEDRETPIDQYALKSESEALTEARGAFCSVFDREGAQEALKVFSNTDFTQESITEYYAQDGNPQDAAEMLIPLNAAVDFIRTSLGRVQESQVGLLWVG